MLCFTRILSTLGVLVVFLSPQRSQSCGLDIFGVCGAGKALEHAIDNLPPELRDAAEQVLDHLFNKDLPPAIDKLTAAAKALEDRAEKDYEKAINATRIQVEELAEKVVTLAEKFAANVTKDVSKIVTQIQHGISGDLKTLFSNINSLVNQLLTRLESDGKELFCAVTGYIDNFEKEFSTYFERQDCDCVQAMLKANPGLQQDCRCTSCNHIGGLYPNCPCKPWGLHFAPGWYNRGKYQFLKCHLNKVINWEHWTVEQIVSQLTIIQEAALSFRCLEDLQPGSTMNRQYFSDEFTNLTHTIMVWTMPSQVSIGRVPVRLPVAPKQPRGDPCAGKTIPQCVTQAMEALETAKQELERAKKDFDEYKTRAEQEFARKNETAQVGEIRSFSQSIVPTGWLPCDGRSIPTTNYRKLYDVIGVTYGSNGVGLFNVPNLTDRTLIGGTKVGSFGGSNNAALGLSNLPALQFQYEVYKSTGICQGGNLACGCGDCGWCADCSRGTYVENESSQINSTGGGKSLPFSTKNPYLVISFGIKF